MEEQRQKLQAEIEYGLKHTVRVHLQITSRDLPIVAEKGRPPMLDPPKDPESFLPKKASLSQAYLSAGIWALLQSEDKQKLEVRDDLLAV